MKRCFRDFFFFPTQTQTSYTNLVSILVLLSVFSNVVFVDPFTVLNVHLTYYSFDVRYIDKDYVPMFTLSSFLSKAVLYHL